MKKVICLILIAVMLMLTPCGALAADGDYVTASRQSPIPVIVVSGDGNPLYDVQGNRVLYYKDLIKGTADDGGEDNSENIKQSVLNVVYPFLVEGVLTNKWDNYFSALQTEVGELFGDTLLDKNGNPINGVDISQSGYASNAYNMSNDKKRNGTYGCGDYTFYYDWRLDPLETADKLHEYITGIKAVTGSEKIALVSRCIGTSIAAAYVAKYGMDDLSGVSFNGGVVNGAELLGEPISGKFNLEPAALNRFLADCKELNLFDIDSFISASLDLLDKNGVFDLAVGVTRATIYGKVVEGMTSALALSTFFTWPSYWAGVTVDDFDTALNYVFGEQGSEKRIEYAGLIEKLENYNSVVRQRLPEIYKTIAAGGNICIISKYGFQIGPICESCNEISDQIATVYSSSCGATTAKVATTLDASYISRRTREGKAAYISPDKQIDASTCQFPDSTWFVKGVSHSTWSWLEDSIATTVASADRQLTVNDFEVSQFIVKEKGTDTLTKMTADNCHTATWENGEQLPVEDTDSLISRIKAFFNALKVWLDELKRIVSEKIAEEQSKQTTVAA